MVVVDTASPFGSRARTQVLLALRLMRESYARELARSTTRHRRPARSS